MTTQVLHARIEPQLKKASEAIFHKIGLTTTDAIRLFFKQVELQNGMPFDVKIPNRESKKALRDARAGKNLTRYDSPDAFSKSLKGL